MKIEIEGELPHLNQYTNANRTHYHKGAKIKKEATQTVVWQAKNSQSVSGEFTAGFHFIFPNRRVDPDNRVSMAIKVILDGLQEAGIIENDNCKTFKGIDHVTWEIGDKMKSIVEINSIEK